MQHNFLSPEEHRALLARRSERVEALKVELRELGLEYSHELTQAEKDCKMVESLVVEDDRKLIHALIAVLESIEIEKKGIHGAHADGMYENWVTRVLGVS